MDHALTRDVVVTGASGFLAARVLAALVARGERPLGISRKPPQVNLPEQAEFALTANYFDAPECQRLIHLAQSPVADVADSDLAEEQLRLCRTLVRRCRRMIYASSSLVYGDTAGDPWSPDEDVTPVTPYAELKRECELMVLEHGGVIVRLANVYGPHMSDGSVLADIRDQLGHAGPLRVRTLTPVRDFIHVDDAARGIVSASNLDVPSGIYNLGSGESLSIGQVASIALEAVGEGEREVTETHPSDRTSIVRLDVQKSIHVLGFTPRTRPQDGIADFARSSRR